MTDTRDPKTELGFDPRDLHARYLAERDKRLRPDGMGQYVQLHGEFESYSVDPRADKGLTRPPLTDSVDVAIVGGGFSGLIAAGRLRQAGVKDIRIIEKGADFGGTWYWNRYPGIRCDVEAYIYMPFLEELGYIPTEKYAGGDEIFAHCQAVARKFDLYSNACLQTQVTSINWDAEAARWVIHTNQDDAMKAKFVCLAGGILLGPSCPGSPASTTTRVIRSIAAAGTTPTPAATPRATSPASAASGWVSSERGPRRSSAFRTSPRPPSSSWCSSAPLPRWTSAPTGLPTPTGWLLWSRAGSASAWRTSPPS